MEMVKNTGEGGDIKMHYITFLVLLNNNNDGLCDNFNSHKEIYSSYL